jgi:hypothetical protein
MGFVRFGLPGLKSAMIRGDRVVWMLSVRSLVRKRLRLVVPDGDTWVFDTPFFWRQGLSGRAGGMPRLLGRVGPRKSVWLMWVEPGRDTLDLLAAVGSMHRSWWHS